MKKFFRSVVALSTAIALSFGVAAAPASAGNGTSNFYIKKSCKIYDSNGFNIVRFQFTNYPSGKSSQTYHFAFVRVLSYDPPPIMTYTKNGYTNTMYVEEGYLTYADRKSHKLRGDVWLRAKQYGCSITG